MARGGYRPGSGPEKGTKYKTKKLKEPAASQPADTDSDAPPENLDPLTYMLKVMNDPTVDAGRRDRMAVAAAPFVHGRKGEGQGKKEDRADKAKSASAGRFAASPPPLKVVK